MNSAPFPDQKVPEFIESLAKEFSLDISDCKHIASSEVDISRSEATEQWDWVLGKQDSSVKICITVLFPTYAVIVSFKNTSVSLPSGVLPYFDFEDYLSKYSKDVSDSGLIAKVVEERSWKADWQVPLEILRKHLMTDLCPILEGKEWPNIEFKYEDYLEPAALSRMYDDGRRILDRRPGAWVYLLDFFRKK